MKTAFALPPARISPRRIVLAVAATLGFTVAVHAQLTPPFDDFAGTGLDTTTWTSRSTHGSGLVSVNNSIATLDVAAAAITSGQRTTLISNYSSLNPFAAPLTITFGGLTVSNTPADPTNAAWGNSFFAAVGRANADLGTLDSTITNNYANVGATYVTALGLIVRQASDAVHLQVIDRGTANHTTASFTITAVPTDLVWVIDGAGTTKTWSLQLVGATFTDTGLADASGTFSRFNEAELDTGESLVSRLAFGAINVGNVGTGTVVTLDSVSTTAIPEPSAFALLASLLIGGAVAGRRTRPARS